MKRITAVFLALLLSCIAYVSAAPAAESDFTAGAVVRLRYESWQNIVDLGTITQKDRNFFRFRFNVWGNLKLNPDNDIYLRLTSEPKYQLGPYRGETGKKVEEDEIIVDNLNFQSKNVFGLPVDVKIGRQDFIGPTGYGDYFLILDGTPADGSRTFYFNAAKARVHLGQNNWMDVIYITDPAYDIYAPSIYAANKRQLNISNEQGFVAYGHGKISDNLIVEPYYMYKTEKGFKGLKDIPDLDINAIGARVVVSLGTWKIRGQYAHEWGTYDNGGPWNKRRANGGYIFVDRQYSDIALKPGFSIGYVYLSGDNPDSKSTNEAWDPLFSRAPEWNELMIYTYVYETLNYGGALPGYWTNLNLYEAKFNMTFDPATKLVVSYQYLTAPEHTDSPFTTMFSNNGKVRGHLPTMILTHAFSKKVSGMAQLEYFVPESFYADHADNGTFLRLQLMFKI
ncbi:MAG: alginate export family protein [Candidatus Sulfobium sp.]